ncbi:MAG: hypothetical protein Q9225_004558 [Loekoesia sp. 1 TL-2023]
MIDECCLIIRPLFGRNGLHHVGITSGVQTYRIWATPVSSDTPLVTVQFVGGHTLEQRIQSELQEALQLVKKSKNINALRKLHATFGYLFCPEATLGGCLQTTKVVTRTEVGEQTAEKESFEASVGLAVSTPVGVGVGMGASRETQDSKENSHEGKNTQEAMVFEATGGNTILAADPPAWSGSVTDFNNWRVIDQKGLTPLADVIARTPGYAAVKSWFLKAVPKLSEYIIIPESRFLNVRFKAITDESLSRISGQALGSDCVVCIKSLADQSKAPVALTVYRNQQGVFLPAITSSDEPSYWRIERATSSSSDVRIKDGEEIRLCWRFSDQLSGFRDYYDDLYGRRRF